MTPPRIEISTGPATPAQLAAWTWLWRRLLAEDRPTPVGKAEMGHDERPSEGGYGDAD